MEFLLELYVTFWQGLMKFLIHEGEVTQHVVAKKRLGNAKNKKNATTSAVSVLVSFPGHADVPGNEAVSIAELQQTFPAFTNA